MSLNTSDLQSSDIFMAVDDSSEKLILVMGETGVGKSTFVNNVTNSNMVIGHDVQSCTTEVQASKPIQYNGYNIKLLDTPGYNDTYKTEAEILLEVARYLVHLHKKNQPIIGIIYIHNINNDRFCADALGNFDLFKRTVGEIAAKNVAVVTTQWDKETPYSNESKKNNCFEQLKGPKYFGKFVKQDAIFKYRKGEHNHILDAIVNNPEVTLQIQSETVVQQKKLRETAAGGLVTNQLDREIQDAKAELKKLTKNKSKDYKGKLKRRDKAMEAEKEKEDGKDKEIKDLEDKIRRLEEAQLAYKQTVEVVVVDHPQSQTSSRPQPKRGWTLGRFKRSHSNAQATEGLLVESQ